MPIRECGERDMGRRRYEIDLAIAQRLIRLVVRENELLHDSKTFASKEIEGNRGDCRKVRIGDEIGDSDAGSGAQTRYSSNLEVSVLLGNEAGRVNVIRRDRRRELECASDDLEGGIYTRRVDLA